MATVLALMALGASPAHRVPEISTPDAVIQHLDLTSFHSRGVGLDDGKSTFAENSFSVVRTTHDSAVLIRKSDGLTKRFDIVHTMQSGLRLCFHDKWVLMPNNPSSMRFDHTYALMVWKAEGRLWKAAIVPGGFMGCINNPSVEEFGRRPPPPPPDTMAGLIEALFPLSHSPQH